MRFDDEITINANADEVWRVYADVERWPEWTQSVRSVRYESGDTLKAGAVVRIEQPKLPKAEWHVEKVDLGRTWTWIAHGPGVRTTAIHTVDAIDDHTTRVRQTLIQDGPIGAVIGRLYGRLTRRYLAMEAAGLKQRCET
jgi:uncharacterized membrane protein